ncbi:MAG: hypothetical protein JNK12_04400 [Acidimicrobiales bacterium]|nr:hypothetical protein [Acidimicrobiales bacterium]
MSDLATHLRGELSERADGPRSASDLPRKLGEAVSRRRRRDRLVLGAAVVALLAMGATSVVLRLSGDEDSTPVVTGPDGGAGQWVPMPESPLSPRTKALTFTLGDEAFLLAGQRLCPPNAQCAITAAEDGAAYDPTARSWRSIANLPVGLTHATVTVLDGRAYVWGEYYRAVPCPPGGTCDPFVDIFLAYDATEDTWTELPLPSQVGLEANRLQAGDVPPQLTTDGRRVIAYLPDEQAASDDPSAPSAVHALAYEPPEPACSTPQIAISCRSPWVELPFDTLRSSTDRTLVGHDGDLYLFATLTTGGTRAALLRAGADEWTALPDPPGPLDFGAYDVGDLIVSPSPGPTSGVPPEVLVTASPAAVFDTRSAQWLDPPQLPFDAMPRPEPALDRLGVVAGPRLIAVGGLVLDLDAASWSALPAPTTLTDEGRAATWVDDTLVVWGGQSPDGEVSAAGATWTPGAIDESPVPDGTATGGWVPMADSPLSPVYNPVAFTVGDEVLVMGGGPACPAGADCVTASWSGSTAAAAYDSAADSWRSIAPLPHTLDEARGVVLDGHLFLWAWYWCEDESVCGDGYVDEFWSYDASDDTWSTLTPPPDGTVDGERDAAFGLTTDGRGIIAFGSIRAGDDADVAYDPAEDAWSPLPVDPLRPTYPRTIIGVGRDLYLFAGVDADPTSTRVAVLREGAASWETLATSHALADPYWYGIGWYRVGNLAVQPSPGPPAGDGADPSAPYTGIFDTTADAWVDPPVSPTDPPPYDTAVLGPVAGDRLIEVAGYVFDAGAGTWTPLPPTDLLADGGAAGAWIGDTLVMWGGADELGNDESDRGAAWSPAP